MIEGIIVGIVGIIIGMKIGSISTKYKAGNTVVSGTRNISRGDDK